jgi:hypothetical protein
MQLQYQWQVQLELQKLNSWSIQCRVTYFFIERGEIREDGLAPTPDLPPLAICAINFSPVLDNPTQPITVHLAFLPLTFHIFSQYHNPLSPITYNLSPIPKDLPLSRGGWPTDPLLVPPITPTRATAEIPLRERKKEKTETTLQKIFFKNWLKLRRF